jgi:hypothetical protein
MKYFRRSVCTISNKTIYYYVRTLVPYIYCSIELGKQMLSRLESQPKKALYVNGRRDDELTVVFVGCK